jgi:hypothetical protein
MSKTRVLVADDHTIVLKRSTRLGWWASITNTNRTRNVAIGTVTAIRPTVEMSITPSCCPVCSS